MHETTRALGVPLRAKVRAMKPRGRSAAPSGASIEFRPRLPRRDLAAIAGIVEANSATELAEALAHAAPASGTDRDSLAMRAACHLLADLCRQGWMVGVERDAVWITPVAARAQDGETPEAAKQRNRTALLQLRDRQLRDPSVRSFLAAMQVPRHSAAGRTSVLDLVDDGHALASQLRDVAMLPPSERSTALARVVQPVVQVVSPDSRCRFTDLPLSDIWRYFRHTWSLEYRPTPGRSLLLLIRNAARPLHPVMGIAALSNAALQLRVRDHWIGWTARALLDRVKSDPTEWKSVRLALLRTLRTARAGIRSDDLPVKPGTPSTEAERRLASFAAAAASSRRDLLDEREQMRSAGEAVASLRALPTTEAGRIDWKTASDAPLFVRKRAGTLSSIMFAERILSATPASLRGASVACLEAPDTQRAIAIAARELRKAGLASRLLDVNVCGAVEPYRDLLGGKLVALLVASAEVADAYFHRYRRQPSEIASQMAGRAVHRDSRIGVLTTTSLYGRTSSQYNRLRVQVPTAASPASLGWEDLGLTEGFGTVHLGDDAVRALRAVAVAHAGNRNVNNVFGEGQSPRLRQVREGLEALGLQPDSFLRHQAPRRVYGLELTTGARDALRLNKSLEPAALRASDIAAAWRERWLRLRITNDSVLQRVATRGPETVRQELAVAVDSRSLASQQGAQHPLVGSVSSLQPAEGHQVPPHDNARLVHGLYRALATCADHHDADTIALLHVETSVDAFVRTHAARRITFVTGNPGDGKTHLIRRLAKELEVDRVEICLDANELPTAALIERIDAASRSKHRGIIIAINEGILVDLLRQASTRNWVALARTQLLQPFVYRTDEPPLDDDVCVVDLGLRNNLAPATVERTLQTLSRLAGPCQQCPAGRCPLVLNSERLRNPMAVGRLTGLLGAVAASGHHATMRDLHAFVAVLLGGTDAPSTSGTPAASPVPYWHNAFQSGDGPLFDVVRRFDPSNLTAPFLDDQLWRHADTPPDWSAAWPDLDVSRQAMDTRIDWLIDRKRRALFEHARGAAYLAAGGPAIDIDWKHLIAGGRSAVRHAVRLLNRFQDRDEEDANLLWLWMTHRFDAHPVRYAAAAGSVPAAGLEVLVPRLRPGLRDAFPDYVPEHVILCAKEAPPTTGLRIDRPLLEALRAAEQGLPSTFRQGEPEARIGAFVARLAKDHCDWSSESVLEVRLVDRDTGGNVTVAVDVHHSRYVEE